VAFAGRYGAVEILIHGECRQIEQGWPYRSVQTAAEQACTLNGGAAAATATIAPSNSCAPRIAETKSEPRAT
jgi:hypothetical protein